MYKVLIISLSLILILVACGADENSSQPQATAYPTEVVWQRAQQVINPTSAFNLQLIGHIDEHATTVNNVVFSGNDLYMATNSVGDKMVRVWNLASGRAILSLNNLSVHAILFGADNETLLTVTSEEEIIEWTLFTEAQTEPPLQAQNAAVGPVAQSDDLKHIAIGGARGRVYLFTTAPLEAQGFIDANPIIAIHQIVLAPDGDHLLTLASGGSLKYWEFAEGDTPLHDFGAFDPSPLQLAISPDGNLVAAAFPNEIRLWRLDNFERQGTLSITEHAASDYLAFSPDGSMVMGYGNNNAVSFWNVRSQRRIVQLPVQPDPIDGAILSNDGRLLLTATQELYLWDLQVLANVEDDQQQIQIPRSRQLAPPGVEVFRPAWSPSNRWLAFADAYGDVFVLGVPASN